MSFLRFIFSSAPICRSTGLFILRLIIGGIFIYAGYYKLSHMNQVVPMFIGMGFPAFFAWLVALIEFIGGIAVILGMFTRLAGGLFTIIMLVVIFKVKWPAGFMAWQSDLVILGASLAIMFAGAGKYSICKTRHDNCGTCDGVNCSCVDKK